MENLQHNRLENRQSKPGFSEPKSWMTIIYIYIRVVKTEAFAGINAILENLQHNRLENRKSKLWFSEQKSWMTNSCWYFGMCFLVHSSALLSVNNLKKQFTSSSFINAILNIEIKKTVNLSSQNLLNINCLFLCYELRVVQNKFRKKIKL
jgi:hypothetical protein